MSVVFAITFTLLAIAGLITAFRLVRGPRTLDRLMAIDVLVVLITAAAAVAMAVTGQGTNIALLVSTALLGFVGSISAVRLTEGRKDHR